MFANTDTTIADAKCDDTNIAESTLRCRNWERTKSIAKKFHKKKTKQIFFIRKKDVFFPWNSHEANKMNGHVVGLIKND